MPTLRQLLIGALLLTLAIAVVAGISLGNAAQPLEQAQPEGAAAQMFSVEMGLSADLSER